MTLNICSNLKGLPRGLKDGAVKQFKKFNNALYNRYKFEEVVGSKKKDVTDVGKFLFEVAAVGWMSVSAANCAAIMLDGKIKTKEKMFLVPQEAADCGINMVLYYLFTSKLMKWSKNLVMNDKIAFTTLRNAVTNDPQNRIKSVVKGIIAKKNFRDSMSVAASLVGAVICSNILTPILRNVYAADRQRQYLMALKDSPENKIIQMRLKEKVGDMDHFIAHTKNSGTKI